MNDDTPMDSISEFIGTETPIQNNIIPMSDRQDLVQHSDNITTNAQDDYEQARRSMKSVIDVGTEIIENLAKVAEESESPRAYEVLANTLKTITDMNKSLMDLHKDARDLTQQKEEGPTTVNNTQYVFNGSTEELQKMLLDKK